MGRLFAEILVLLAFVVAVVLIRRWIVAHSKYMQQREADKRNARDLAMTALASKDRGYLCDVIVMYGDLLPKKLRIQLEARAQDMFLDEEMNESPEKKYTV